MTRDEYLEWSKQRAIAICTTGEWAEGLTSHWLALPPLKFTKFNEA